ncbi:helicase-related protein [Desulfolucanica intricata]|uniref:helicase-related protein n=1 Tax=Desulfolucanica intricata TaxID=1285191 RepID=UPI000836B527|nr:helicase-related protein [Desulfolucanica intricata]
MTEQYIKTIENKGLRSRAWLLSYKTSSTVIDGRPVNILKDFYIPALSLSARYDRMAGYFRSSSLAAASQGFSSFVGRKGKMRLIVGADLEPGDVRAILDGDSKRLETQLNTELEGAESWPVNVKNGMTLLAWMVSYGHLEVRVAFRVHGKTGEPISFESVEDGYVHEKWFVLHDEFGNRLYGSGTLNESKTALVLNAENIDVHCDWWGETERVRVDDAEKSFEDLWNGRSCNLLVMTLPEAVQHKLVKLAEGIDRPVEIDGSSSVSAGAGSPSVLERLRFAVLRDGPKMPGGRLVGMETAPVKPWPHQAVVVRRLVETWPHSYLLCDEVGLGKTIEAGLAFRSLYLSGLVKRILIAAPKSLTRQWHRQMASKVLLSFGLVRTGPGASHEYIFPSEETLQAASIFEPDLAIVSTGLLARRDRARDLLHTKPFDIALVDEAHAARRRNPTGGPGAPPDFGHLYTSISDYLRKSVRSLWLATATPMQINPVEVCDLLALTNRVGAFQLDPSLTLQYYEILGRLVHGEELSQQEWEFLRQAVGAVKMQDPLLWNFIEECVIDGRISSTVRQWLDRGRNPRGRERNLISRLIFTASPLARVMLRHTRQLLEIYRDKGQLQENLARRNILPLPRIYFTSLERRIYDQLEDYCRGLARQINRHGDYQSRQMAGFLLSLLRLRFASSLYAFRETLRRRLSKVEATLRHQSLQINEEADGEDFFFDDFRYGGEDEDDAAAVQSLLKNRTKPDLEWERTRLKAMLDEMSDLTGPSSKMTELLRRLDRRRDGQTGRIRQTVIFTRFYDTLQDIVSRLRRSNPGMLIGTYSGKGGEYFDSQRGEMISVNREDVKERFICGEIDVLVCTDAAAEGLNLQTADFLVNFDLGWNPMKVEQRIGRIDRIGQKHKNIYVLNLCYVDSVEEIVYGRLLDRLAKASMIVGTQQISMLPLETEDFEQLAAGEITPEELEYRALERVKEQKKYRERMEIPPQELYEIYMRISRKAERASVPVDLPAIWEALSSSQYLRELGCAADTVKSEQIIRLSGIGGVPDGTVLTVSRQLFDEGMAGGGNRVHFASYGDPYFDAVLDHMNSFDLPGCVRRIAVPVRGMDGVEIVGYAVACRGAGGAREVRFVRGWKDLKEIVLAEEESLTEAEVEPIQRQLEHMAIEEFEPCRAAERIERENVRAARAQEMLNFLVIQDLLGNRAKAAGEGALFWPAMREVESLFEDRENVIVPGLPADLLRPVESDLLFQCQIPTVGNKAHIRVPRILGRTAIDAAVRVAGSMKAKKSTLTADRVLGRLKKEVKDLRLRL